VCAALVAWRIPSFRSLLKSVPLIGPLVHWSSLADCYGYMSIFVAERLPLPVAVQLSKDALRDSHLADSLQRVVEDVQGGTKLSDSIQRRIPRGLWPVVAWGEVNDGLADTLEVASEIAEQRTFAQAELIRIVLPPLLLIPTVLGVIVCSFGLLLPLMSLLNALGKG
jgi:type II secretory pathway component PulF